MSDREAFEVRAKARGMDLRRDGLGEYWQGTTFTAWVGWKWAMEYERRDSIVQAGLLIEVVKLREAVAKMSHRQCQHCGHTAYYLSNLIEQSRCEKCNSTYTRSIERKTK
jgi:predicted Zn-ribbon and HTH transcriptional regulator